MWWLRTLSLLIVLFLIALPARAQGWAWAASAGGTESDQAEAVAVDAAGNAYVVGTFEGTADFGAFTLTSAGEEDVFVAKYAPSGEVLWVRRGGGTGLDLGHGIAVDAGGDVYVTGQFGYPGTTATFGDVTLTSTGASDAFLVRYSPDGDVRWARGAGGTDTDRGMDVVMDAAGNLYVAGAFSNTAAFGSHTLTSAGYTDAFLAKYTPDGDVLWAERGGGGGGDGVWGVATDAAGNAYIVGSFSGTATFGVFTLPSAGFPDAFLIRYSPDGDVLWARAAGGGATDLGLGVAADAAGNAYVTGYFQGTAVFGDFTLSATGYIDGFVARYDPSGEVLWVAPAHASASHAAFITDVAVDAGDVTVTGRFSGTITLGPYTLTNVGNGVGNTDVVLARYAASGEVAWAERAGGPGGAGGSGVVLGATGDALVAGSFSDTAAFGSHTLTSAGSSDVYLASFESPAAVAVSAVPVSPPVVIPPAGGSFQFTVTLTNTTDQPQTFQAWTAATGPVSREPVVGPETVTLPAGATVVRTLTQQVPGNAPPGTYTYHVRVGSFPSPVAASASFPFEKQAGAARESAEAGGWAVSGWGEAVEASADLPEGFALSEAHPNPFEVSTTLRFGLAEAGPVRLTVYDALGRAVAVLVDGTLEAGAHEATFEAAAQPSGVYLVRLEAAGTVQTQRVTRLR